MHVKNKSISGLVASNSLPTCPTNHCFWLVSQSQPLVDLSESSPLGYNDTTTVTDILVNVSTSPMKIRLKSHSCDCGVFTNSSAYLRVWHSLQCMHITTLALPSAKLKWHVSHRYANETNVKRILARFLWRSVARFLEPSMLHVSSIFVFCLFDTLLTTLSLSIELLWQTRKELHKTPRASKTYHTPTKCAQCST